MSRAGATAKRRLVVGVTAQMAVWMSKASARRGPMANPPSRQSRVDADRSGAPGGVGYVADVGEQGCVDRLRNGPLTHSGRLAGLPVGTN